eukprot:2521858-Pyramimonas_sp.AAC.1
MGPLMAEDEAVAAACAPRSGLPAAPKKPRTKGHSYPGSFLRVAENQRFGRPRFANWNIYITSGG